MINEICTARSRIVPRRCLVSCRLHWRMASLLSGAFQVRSRSPGWRTQPTSQTLVVFGSERLTETLGIPIVRGRGLSTIDVEQAHHVAVINETLARRYFGSEDPISRVIRLPRLTTLPSPITDPTFEVIGVMREVATMGPVTTRRRRYCCRSVCGSPVASTCSCARPTIRCAR